MNGSSYFSLNFTCFFGLVRADTEDDRALALELAPDVADPARLRGASGRVVFRVKIQYDRRTPKRGERERVSGRP